ncbi:MAG: flagellin, partial [Anaerovibrio sp.]|nr:flagellin [Anaerovibrio sp.]
MSMVVKNNISALNTLNTLNKNQAALTKSLKKVSSGMKINSAADDASGYAISERMRVQIRSLDQANANTQNGSSMMKTAEGAVNSTVEILRTLKEKAINAANDSNTDSDRLTIQKELDQSIDQINDNANVTFNGKYLVDGSKNTKGNATYTALSNQSLAEDTTASTALTALKARNGDSLEIHDTDKVTVSYVQGGKTYTAHFDVKDEATGNIATLGDIFKKAEEINANDKIFAAADNKSVLAAQVKDGTITQTQADSIAQTIQTAAGNYDATINSLVTAQNGLASDVTTTTTGVKDTVDAYNNASAAYAGMVADTVYQNVAANDSVLSSPVSYVSSTGTTSTVAGDYGGYLDSISTSARSVVRTIDADT